MKGEGAAARAATAVFALVLLATGCSDDDGGEATDTTAPSTSTPSTVTADPEWPVYGHDLANTRSAAVESGVTADSVDGLTESWALHDLVGVTGTPVVTGGTLYFGDWEGTVHALDPATGEPVWSTAVGGSFVGSPAVTEELVLVAAGGRLVALDRATGAQAWEAVTSEHPQAQINASPVVVDDLVLQGTAGFENILVKDDYTFRGAIGAWDVATGEQVWNFETTGDDAEGGAGAGVWSTPAVDLELGVLYVGTGQTLEEPTGPLADSILAIDVRTGELVWSQQFTYPDVFSNGNPTGKDADVGASPNLWSVGGRDFVGAGDKGGTFHALDRGTGEIVWEAELTMGGVFGGQIGSSALVDGVLVATSNGGDPDAPAPTDTTRAFGLDPATGEILWSTEPMPGKVFGPVSAVPGVAFVGTDRNQMLALDPATGEELWALDAPGPIGGGASIVEGRVHWGYGFTLFGAPGPGGLLTFEVPA